jgi:peptide/nickel transport system ATP-binding protein/oligopeptide transport system ATP-binding protein
MMSLLHISGLTTEFRTDAGWCAAVRDVDLEVQANETLAIVGESGSGKSVTALSILRLLPEVGARIANGTCLFEEQDLARLDEAAMERVRGARIGMVFQEPMTALNPTMTVGNQIGEVLKRHRGLSSATARAETLRLLERVRLPSPARRIDDYPHQFSGGMRQRVVIAMAIACRPALLLADEPTTALDVTIQAQILRLLKELQREHGMGMIFITHNLGVVAQIADRVAVMYAGRIVESAPVDELFAQPRHPYTQGLLRAMPRHDRMQDLEPIPGAVPSIRETITGCAFAPRCPRRIERCAEAPLLEPVAANHAVRCWVAT